MRLDRMIQRRTFLGACAGGLVLAHSGAGAQSIAKPYRVGFLTFATREQSAPLLREFTEGLRELGYVDGRNIVIVPHHGDGTLNQMQDLAAGVVRSRVDVIVTGTNPIVAAVKRATATIPIVMVGALDPVGFGLVRDLARPGGNLTGLCVDASDEMSGKMLALLTEIVPGLSRVGVLRQAGYRDVFLESAAKRLNIDLHAVDVRTIDELEGAFATLPPNRVAAVIVRGPFYVHRQRIAELALKHRLPAIHALKEYAQAGLLVTYGANLADLYRRAASFVDRIAKGANAGDLPVEQPTKFDLVINLRTAKALGVTIPPSLLLRANAVIR
jgi:putative ABC transport system substrate-binding protein